MNLFGYVLTLHAERAIPRLPSLGQWRHEKTGGIYNLISRDARLRSEVFLMDMEPVTLLYKNGEMIVDHPSRTHYHRHMHFYSYAKSQSRIPLYSGARMCVYVGEDGKHWVREITEFAQKFTLYMIRNVD